MKTKTLKIPKLNSCPFCNGVPEMVVSNVDDKPAWRVECFRKSCMAVMFGRSPKDAAKRWNRRPEAGEKSLDSEPRPSPSSVLNEPGSE